MRLCSCDATTRSWLEAQRGEPLPPDAPLPDHAGARLTLTLTLTLTLAEAVALALTLKS